MPGTGAVLEPTLLKEAADWAIVLHYDDPGEAERQAFEHWRQRSPAHDAAWARAQEVLHTFGQVPATIGKDAVRSLGRGRDRRRALQLLGSMLLLAPAAWLALRQAPWREWGADIATGTGERQDLALPDGSRLVLNTASAVNIAFSSAERRIFLLAGEILVTTHADPQPRPRPFLVDTRYGVLRALGTRFSVRQLEARQACQVAVYQSAVEVRPQAGPARVLQAGEQARFGAAGVERPLPVDDSAALWERGMLLARDMRLGEVIEEMARYRPGVLRCDPAVAELRLSGAISLADTDAGLAMLERTLPVRIGRSTRYWVTVQPR